MRYSLALLFGSVLLFSLSGCNSSSSDTTNDDTALEQTTVTQEETLDTVTTLLPTNEGSAAEPIALTLQNVYHGKIGIESDDAQYSYYSFRTTQAGDYSYTLSNLSDSTTDLDVLLFDTNIDLVAYNTDTSTYPETYTFFNLDANTTYILQVSNDTDQENVTFDLVVSLVNAQEVVTTANEGTLDAPKSISLNTLYSAKVGMQENEQEYSYYSFVAQKDGNISYQIASVSPYTSSLDTYFYEVQSDGNALTYWNASSHLYPEINVIENVTADNTYILKVKNLASADTTFNLYVTQDQVTNEATSLNNALALDLGELHHGYVGSSDSIFKETYYSIYSGDSDGDDLYLDINITQRTPSTSKLQYKIYKKDEDGNFESPSVGTLDTEENVTDTFYVDKNTSYIIGIENLDGDTTDYDIIFSQH